MEGFLSGLQLHGSSVFSASCLEIPQLAWEFKHWAASPSLFYTDLWRYLYSDEYDTISEYGHKFFCAYFIKWRKDSYEIGLFTLIKYDCLV